MTEFVGPTRMEIFGPSFADVVDRCDGLCWPRVGSLGGRDGRIWPHRVTWMLFGTVVSFASADEAWKVAEVGCLTMMATNRCGVVIEDEATRGIVGRDRGCGFVHGEC